MRTIEPDEGAEAEWNAHVTEVSRGTLRARDTNNWYLGQNVPGKPQAFMTYPAGLSTYRAICDGIAAEGYRGFAFDRAPHIDK